jgi:hypothetical protein
VGFVFTAFVPRWPREHSFWIILALIVVVDAVAVAGLLHVAQPRPIAIRLEEAAKLRVIVPELERRGLQRRGLSEQERVGPLPPPASPDTDARDDCGEQR